MLASLAADEADLVEEAEAIVQAVVGAIPRDEVDILGHQLLQEAMLHPGATHVDMLARQATRSFTIIITLTVAWAEVDSSTDFSVDISVE